MAALDNVTWQTFTHDQPFFLETGGKLPGFSLRYETYGTLSAEKNNAVLVCHALTGDHHAAGYYEGDKKPGWWDTCIGPGKALDTNKFFVVSLNNLGGCSGSTGPTSVNPETNELWGPDFPEVRVGDWVKTQSMLADHLDIAQWCAVMGGSLGGMQVMEWSIRYPKRIRYAGIFASAPYLTPQNIAFNEVARQAIISDDNFHDGYYGKKDTKPIKGLGIARMIGHITYLSLEAINSRFDRRRTDLPAHANPDFPIVSYLHYQGGNFTKRFDANTYILFTKVLEHFNPALIYDDDLVQTFSRAECEFLVVSFSSDWRFSPSRSREIVNALMEADKKVSYLNIESDKGHDAFLLPEPRYLSALKTWFERIHNEITEVTA